MRKPRPLSPYHAPGFYDQALAAGRHRDIVGGRWDETGRVMMGLLLRAGLQPHHRLLDIGCGSLRLGCKAISYLDPGNYWGTDLSGALMHRGYEVELTKAQRERLPAAQLIEDADFAFPGVPADIDMAIAFAVFTHLPGDRLAHALHQVRARFPALSSFLFTAFLAPDDDRRLGALRQPDGVVTHPDRAPYHQLASDIANAAAAGFTLDQRPDRLPRGQVLFVATPA